MLGCTFMNLQPCLVTRQLWSFTRGIKLYCIVGTLGTPTLPLFINFPTSTGRVNIAEKIGTEYYEFGLTLLEDNFGDITDAIRKEYHGNAKDINCQIFKQWMKGIGRAPLSWDTLASVLQDIGLERLACNIRQFISSQ